jgi:Flp pilus assembly protein TadD
MGILALFLVSCGLEPQIKVNGKDELDKLKGPETGSVESSLKSQADQAEAAHDYKRAAQIYKQLADTHADKNIYQLDLADDLRRAGDNDGALRTLDALLKKEPDNAGALEVKGLTLMAAGEFPEAGTTLGQAMKIDPKRWRTLNGIGILFAMKGKYDGAIAYFQAALDVSTDNPSVLNNAALTYAIDRQFPRAYDAFERARRHLQADSPELKHLDLNRALVYAVDGKLDEAEQAAAPHLTKEALYNNMGFYSALAKNNEQARVYLNMALTQSPTYYERAWKNLGALSSGDNATGNGVPPETSMPVVAPSPEGALKQQGAPQAGVPLSDIPESMPLHSDPASPYAGTVGAAPSAGAATPTASEKTNTDAPQINPDVILLKKPKETSVPTVTPTE